MPHHLRMSRGVRQEFPENGVASDIGQGQVDAVGARVDADGV